MTAAPVARAPKRCAKRDCFLYQPCPKHGSWRSVSKKPLPSDWKRRVTAVKKRDRVCVLCGRPGKSVDHIVERADGGTDDLANLRLLCDDCHQTKTAASRKKRRESRNQPRHQNDGKLRTSSTNTSSHYRLRSDAVGGSSASDGGSENHFAGEAET